MIFLQLRVLASLRLVSQDVSQWKPWRHLLRLIDLLMNVVHLSLLKEMVWLVILTLDPLVLLLSGRLIGAGWSWDIKQELAWSVAPNIMSIAHDGASLDGVVHHRLVVTDYIVMVPRSINWFLSCLNRRVPLAKSVINQKTICHIWFLLLLLRWEQCNFIHSLWNLRLFLDSLGLRLLSWPILWLLFSDIADRVIWLVESEVEFRSLTLLVFFLDLNFINFVY